MRRKTYDYTYKYKGNLVEKAALNVPEYPCPAKGDKALLKTALDKMAANNFVSSSTARHTKTEKKPL